MAKPKPVSLTQVASEDYEGGYAPEPLLVVGDIPGGGGGGGSGFPVESPDGQTEATFGDAGLSVLSDAGFDTTIGKDGFKVTSPSGAVNAINVQGFDGATYVEIGSDGVGFIIFSGAVNTVVPINQMAGTATLDTHLVTKGYVDAAIAAALA